MTLSRLAKLLVVCGAGTALSCQTPAVSGDPAAIEPGSRWGLAIHTGAGNFTLDGLGERRDPMESAMMAALAAGHDILAGGGSGLDAVQAAVVLLEDSPLFNAGRGAVFTHAGTHELDASIMDGATRRAGAVAGLRHVKNPILLARLIMERSPHVLLAGEGAEAFAREQGGIEFVEPRYFHTDRAWQALERAREEERRNQNPQTGASVAPAEYLGTVGAVALDRQGHLAAATSTGGMTNKRAGRIGDSPIIGAGTYASDRCAVSSTGHGEYFIRYAVAHDICARMEYRAMPLQDAADAVVQNVLRPAGGDGGVIGMDRDGNVAMSLNVTGMGRGHIGADGRPVVRFAAEEGTGR